MSDDYLDNQVVSERKRVWKKRFEQPNDKQKVILAENDDTLVGLSCVYLDTDETYGSLLDNLHVHHDYMRKGIGKMLIKKSTEQVLNHDEHSSMYLWVLIQNINAIKFYEAIGGIRNETKAWRTPDNSNPDTYRYVWNDLKVLSNVL